MPYTSKLVWEGISRVNCSYHNKIKIYLLILNKSFFLPLGLSGFWSGCKYGCEELPSIQICILGGSLGCTEAWTAGQHRPGGGWEALPSHTGSSPSPEGIDWALGTGGLREHLGTTWLPHPSCGTTSLCVSSSSWGTLFCPLFLEFFLIPPNRVQVKGLFCAFY